VRCELCGVTSSPGSLTFLRAVDFEDPDRDYRHARPDLDAPPRSINSDSVLVAPMQAGDMLVWSSYTLHSAPGNHLSKRRAAFSVNSLGDDVTYNGQPALDTCTSASLVVGEPMVCDKFPQARPVPNAPSQGANQ